MALIGKTIDDEYIVENSERMIMEIGKIRTHHKHFGRKLKKIISEIMSCGGVNALNLSEEEYEIYKYIDNGIDIDSAQIRQYENCGTLYVVFHSDDTDDFPTMWDTSESEKVFKLRKVEEIKRCDLSFNVSFTIDKLTTDNTMNIELNSDNAPNTITGDNKLKISITPFSAEVITDSSENGILFENENDLKKLASSYAEIVLKNGNKYYFDLLGGIDKLYLNDDTNFESVINKRIKLSGEALMYRDSKSPVENDMMEYYHCERNIDKTTIIDPTNISKVIINGDTVYSA